GSLAVLGHAQAVVDGGVAAGGVQAGCAAQVGGRHARDGSRGLGRVFRAADELQPFAKGTVLAAGADEVVVYQVFRDDDVGQGVEHGDVGARAYRQVVVGLHVRPVDQFGAAWIDHDQARTLT